MPTDFVLVSNYLQQVIVQGVLSLQG